MLDMAEALKTAYRNDGLPYAPNILKNLTLYFPELQLTITDEKIVTESMELTESLCSDTDLVYGSCEAAQMKIRIANVSDYLAGKKMVVTQSLTVSGVEYTVPLGTYKIMSAVLSDDLWFRDLTGYDCMLDTDADVSAWYNALTFDISMTLKAFRESLLTHLGIAFTSQTLANDSIVIEKTISPTSLIGRDVLEAICEINGGFGHIGRDNKFKVINLAAMGLYPSETLYPANNIYPADITYTNSANEVFNSQSSDGKSIVREEYTVAAITGVRIREDGGDVGASVGSDVNVYSVENNFLVFGKNSSDLISIANALLVKIGNRPYIPSRVASNGRPWLEVGDTYSYDTGSNVYASYILSRSMIGIQVLRDEYASSGNEKRSEVLSQNTQFEQLKSKTLKINKSVDSLSTEVSDLEEETSASIQLLSDSITSEVRRAQGTENALQSSIQQNAENILLKVSEDSIVAAINMSPETIKIAAAKIDISGLVTFTDLSVSGRTTINADNITTGKINSIEIQNSNVYIGSDQIQFTYGGAIKRASTLGSTSGIDNVISFTLNSIQIGQHSGNITNRLDIPMEEINVGYATYPGYSEVNIWSGNGLQIYLNSNDYLTTKFSVSPFSDDDSSLAPVGAVALGLTSRPYSTIYFQSLSQRIKTGVTSKIGLFGCTPISQRTVAKLATSANLDTVITKINSLLDALGNVSGTGYGLIDL